MTTYPMKLIAKTNRIGIFQNRYSETINNLHATEQYNLHVDSSHNIEEQKNLSKNIYSTGFVMQSGNQGSTPYSFGGSIRYDDESYGSHVFELHGILDTLVTLTDYFRKYRYPVNIKVFTDNRTTVEAYEDYREGKNAKNRVSALLYRIFEENEALLNRFNTVIAWEKGHHAKNVANNLADTIARSLRHEGKRHHRLTPLQLCGVLMRTSRKGNHSAYDYLMNDYMFRMFTGAEKSAVIQVSKSPRRYGYSYKVYYDGEASAEFVSTSADSVHDAMNMATEELCRMSSFVTGIPKVYLVGSGFDRVESQFHGKDRLVPKLRKKLNAFYKNEGVLFNTAVLLGGCCDGKSDHARHARYNEMAQSWEDYKMFTKKHYSTWDNMSKLRQRFSK